MTSPSHAAPRSGAGADRRFGLVTSGRPLRVQILLGAAAATLAWGGRLAFETFGWSFVTSSDWDAVAGKFGALVPIYGTLVTSLLALIIAVPVSIGIALFLTDIAPRWLRGPVGMAIELLAAIPSIIYGMWGLFVFAPFMAAHVEPWLNDRLGPLPVVGALFTGPSIGIGLLTAGLVLGIMIIPFISAVARDVFNAVPTSLKEAAVALGSTRWEILSRVTLPYTRSAIIGAIFLGLGRALGETMAVTFVIGNAHRLKASLFAPGNSIASALANEFTEAVGELYTSALIELGLILFLITTIVLACSKLLLLQLARREGAST